MDSTFKDYISPTARAIDNSLATVVNRITDRAVADWTIGDYRMIAAATRQISEDCEWVLIAYEVIKDVEEMKRFQP